MASRNIDACLESNRTAIAKFVSTLLDLSASRWDEPRRTGKWSPAQITEHVAITYERAALFVEGSIAVSGRRPPRFLRPFIRTLIRVTALRTGRFIKSKTPAAFEPSPRPASQQVLCERLQRASRTFEARAREKVNAGIRTFEHPYFGTFGIEEFVRLEMHHVHHHRRQILELSDADPTQNQ